MALPSEVRDLAHFGPAEDALLAILAPRLPGVSIQSLLWKEQPFPAVLVRRMPHWGFWGGDPRFIDEFAVKVDTFTEGLDADAEGALLSEAVRKVIYDSYFNQTVYPGVGHVVGVRLFEPPRRVADWATATGPVQYADLPNGVTRYEASYELRVKRPTGRYRPEQVIRTYVPSYI